MAKVVPRYDETQVFHLAQRSAPTGAATSIARLCLNCGGLVADRSAHDLWHDWVGR